MDDLFTQALTHRRVRADANRRPDRLAGVGLAEHDEHDEHNAHDERDSSRSPREQYVRVIWRSLVQRAEATSAPLYFYGAGRHTDWLLGIIHDIRTTNLAGLLDDEPTGGHRYGYPVLRAGDRNLPTNSIVLISSDRFEEQLASRARQHWPNGVRIVRLYDGLPPGPYPVPATDQQLERARAAVRQARRRWGGSEFVGPYEQAGAVTGFLEEQWLWSHRGRLRGRILDMSTPRHWHEWVAELPQVRDLLISDLDRDFIMKGSYASPVDIKADFCAASVPVDEDSFSTILCLSILEHGRDPLALLTNLRRVLEPAGTLMLTVPFACPDGHDRPDFWRFGGDGLRLLAEQAGFREMVCGSLGDVGPVLSDILGCDAGANDHHEGIPLIKWLMAS